MGKFDALSTYITEYWQRLSTHDTLESKTSIGLPRPYFSPSTEVIDGFTFDQFFYWDTYFICLGLLAEGRYQDVLDQVENMCDLIERFGFVPNSTSFGHLSRSQPPLFAQLVADIEPFVDCDEAWYKRTLDAMCEEYNHVWRAHTQPHIRDVYHGLSRYYDSNVLHALAEAESGWDYTTRFENRCLDFVPIDLNAFLFTYEKTIAKWHEKLNQEAGVWLEKIDQRIKSFDQVFWSNDFYYDFDYKYKRHSSVRSLAAYAPLFVGMVSDRRAGQLRDALKTFETEYGLLTTTQPAPDHDKQWAHPNGWAPLHFLVVMGLENYGFTDDAGRIAEKWVTSVNNRFQSDGQVYEKYNVVDLTIPGTGSVYPDQKGFGWTNGVTQYFIHRYNL